jgi:hypothetical protein
MWLQSMAGLIAALDSGLTASVLTIFKYLLSLIFTSTLIFFSKL